MPSCFLFFNITLSFWTSVTVLDSEAAHGVAVGSIVAQSSNQPGKVVSIIHVVAHFSTVFSYLIRNSGFGQAHRECHCDSGMSRAVFGIG